MKSDYNVALIWDAEASVWVATSEDIQGLVLESGSLDALIEKVRVAAPELLALKHDIPEILSVCFRSERYEQVRA
ncbi:antitoxin HicB [Clostridia bacterium]|nr:antitoxin HicB [Clostridia bacterium]